MSYILFENKATETLAMWNPPSPSNHIVKSEVFGKICAYSKGMSNGGNKLFCYKNNISDVPDH
jgi:hypothetical protein